MFLGVLLFIGSIVLLVVSIGLLFAQIDAEDAKIRAARQKRMDERAAKRNADWLRAKAELDRAYKDIADSLRQCSFRHGIVIDVESWPVDRKTERKQALLIYERDADA